MQDVITDSQKKSEKLQEVASDHQELTALEKRVDDERMKNLCLERANSELQQQLEEQKRVLEAQKSAHQEQLKEQKKAHQAKPLIPSSTCTYQFILDSEKALHHRTSENVNI
jgi:nitrate reductase cytochrome c-type subunit